MTHIDLGWELSDIADSIDGVLVGDEAVVRRVDPIGRNLPRVLAQVPNCPELLHRIAFVPPMQAKRSQEQHTPDNEPPENAP